MQNSDIKCLNAFCHRICNGCERQDCGLIKCDYKHGLLAFSVCSAEVRFYACGLTTLDVGTRDIYCNYWLVANYVVHLCLFHVYNSSIDMLKCSILTFRAVTPRGRMYGLQCFGSTYCIHRKGFFSQNITFINNALYIYSSLVDVDIKAIIGQEQNITLRHCLYDIRESMNFQLLCILCVLIYY
jgi:hypothetical protein